MSDDELRFINAFIGFCIASGNTWPVPLAELRYVPVGVEKEVATLAGPMPREVVPELICASSMVNHVVLLEAKSATVSDRQGRTYARILSSELWVQGFLPTDIDPTRLTHDAIYISRPENADSLIADLGRANLDLPLITGDEISFQLRAGQISQRELNATFVKGIVVRGYEWPMHFVPLTSRSSESLMAPFILRAASHYLMNGQQFTVEDVGQRGVPHWSLCGRTELNLFRRRITGILQEAGHEELAGYYSRLGSNQAWQPLKSAPLSVQGLDKLSSLITEYVRRKQQNVPYRKDQPPLFSESALE